MDLQQTLLISAGGMRAQGTRLKVIAENLANAQSTSEVPGGDPYRRRTVSFHNELDRASGLDMVQVSDIKEDQSSFSRKYEPSHPSADEEGYVLYPNVSSLIEMMDMKEAQRSYEANLNVIEASKKMLSRTIDLLRG